MVALSRMLFITNETGAPYPSLVGLSDHSLHMCSPLYVSLEKKCYFILMRLSNLDRISISGIHFNANCLSADREKHRKGSRALRGWREGVIRGKTGKFGLIIVQFL